MITKKQAQKFAKIHIAIHSSGIDQTAFEGCGIDEDQIQKLIDSVVEESMRIGKKLNLNFSHNKDIIEYVKNNF